MHACHAMPARCNWKGQTRKAQECEPALQRPLTVVDPDWGTMAGGDRALSAMLRGPVSQTTGARGQCLQGLDPSTML